MGKASGGRLVLNHSTHIPGLISILERLTQQVGIQTVTPGVIASARSHAPKMTLKPSVPIRGGFKLIARQGKTVQEVFVLTSLNKEQLEAAIAQIMK
ncbi:MAG: metal-binding protein [Leptolyngbyaceae cyanobacterium RU_5_1]|nr:metal-binding protein [Leptolyngbyaceae cyanobacterium RU_5_1]